MKYAFANKLLGHFIGVYICNEHMLHHVMLLEIVKEFFFFLINVGNSQN